MERKVCEVSVAPKDAAIWSIPQSVMFTRSPFHGVKITFESSTVLLH